MRILSNIKFYRLRKLKDDGHCWTVRDLGRISGVAYQRICEMERGALLPSEDELKKIATALDVNPDDLYSNKVREIATAEER